MQKIKTRVFKLTNGFKVTVESNYTEEDAFADLKKEVETLGGKAVKKNKEIIISNISVNIAERLLIEFSKSLNEDCCAVQKHEHNFSYSFEDLINALERQTKKENGITDADCQALSTWQFSKNYYKRLDGITVKLVGTHYCSKKAQKVVASKKINNLALLVTEPNNLFDPNAIMILMWDSDAKVWCHVGYVRATQAALLILKWPNNNKDVAVAQISCYPKNPDGHREGNNIELTLTGEVRKYPSFQY